MAMLAYLKNSSIAAVWFVFLTFPLVVVKVNTLKNTVEWRWINMLWVAVGAFILSAAWRWAMQRRAQGASKKEQEEADADRQPSLGQRLRSRYLLSLPESRLAFAVKPSQGLISEWTGVLVCQSAPFPMPVSVFPTPSCCTHSRSSHGPQVPELGPCQPTQPRWRICTRRCRHCSHRIFLGICS